MDLIKTCAEKTVIAAHRGVAGGNIPCNTLAAYDIALDQGADMLEVDVDMTADGKLIIFHPGEEHNHLRFTGSVENYTLAQIQDVLRYVNYDGTQTEWTVCTFDEVLERYGQRCFINVDKFWGHPVEISAAIKDHGVEDSILVKSKPKPAVFDTLREVAPNIMFMAILGSDVEKWHNEFMASNINYVGAELLFAKDGEGAGRPEIREMLKKDGKIIWGNSILYDYRIRLSADHTDDVALLGDKYKGWGWYVDSGYDIIQTDWPLALSIYLEKSGKRYKK